VEANEAGDKFTELMKKMADKMPKAKLDASDYGNGAQGGLSYLGASKDPALEIW